MKKYIKYVLLFMFFILIVSSNKVNASAGSTVFIGEPVVLNNYTNIEISYNNVEINEETSEIKNIQLFTNLSDKTLTRKASIKLEDSYNNFTINSLKIFVNGIEIKEITKDGDNYIFNFQILPNEGKKIEIRYKTDNNLQDAKIIKYTMDAIKGQKVKLFQINVKLSKYDIPLVQKIWPGAYEFENNIVSTEYFDFTVNNLTSDFIIQKETYKNLKYGDYAETYTDEEKHIINNAKQLIDNGIPNIDYSDIDNVEMIKSWYVEIFINLTNSTKDYVDFHDTSAAESIFMYVMALQLEKDGQEYYINEEGEKISNLVGELTDYCLTIQEIRRIDKDCVIMPYGETTSSPIINLFGKKVAINYYETEGDKVLYVNKNMQRGDYEHEYVISPEYSILRTQGSKSGWQTKSRGYKKVFVNSDIDGNKIDVTEEEIIQFVNMMNIDLYLRVVIYDPSDKYKVEAGYYTDISEEIAFKYVNAETTIEYHRKELKGIEEEFKLETSERYGDEEWFKEAKEWHEEFIDNAKNSYRKFDNEVVVNNSKVPTLAHCVGYCINTPEKNIVYLYEYYYLDGLGDIYSATECEAAKAMLETNKANNNSAKSIIINKINNTKITQDLEEYSTKTEEILENNQNTIEKKLNTQDIIILASIIGAVIILIIILVVILIKRRKENGRKEI